MFDFYIMKNIAAELQSDYWMKQCYVLVQVNSKET